MADIHYAVEIDTTGSDTIAAIGMISGTMRFVTDRPDYDGTPTYPKWEDDSDNTAIWYEGFILRDGLGKCSRQIDITVGGDYGTFSGFTFSVRNDQKFWDTILENEIHLMGQSVKFFVIIDDKFYQVWSGIISNNPYNETDYKFVCKDNFSNIHKQIPPELITTTNYPNAVDEAISKPVPICIGRIPYAELLNTGGTPSFIELVGGDTYYGDSTTKMQVKPDGNTAIYEWMDFDPSHGTDPAFETNGMKVGDTIVIDCDNFSPENNGTFTITYVDDLRFYVTKVTTPWDYNKLLGKDTALLSQGQTFNSCAAKDYETPDGASPTLELYTKNKIFSVNALGTGEYFLIAVSGKNPSPDTGDCIKIKSNLVTDGTGYTKITLSEPLKNVSATGSGITFGASSTQFDIIELTQDTFKYFYDGTGTDPDFVNSGLRVGDDIVIDVSNFDAGNNGTFEVTTIADDYFIVHNTGGKGETDKTIGSGSISTSKEEFLDYQTSYYATPEDFWYFQIIKVQISKVVSNEAITSFERIGGNEDLFRYSTAENKYHALSNLIVDTDISTSTVEILSDKIDRNNSIKYFYPISLPGLDKIWANADPLYPVTSSQLLDKSRATFNTYTFSHIVGVWNWTIELWAPPPDLETYNDFDELYMCVDFDYSFNINIKHYHKIEGINLYNNHRLLSKENGYPTGNSSGTINMLPNYYYRDGYIVGDETSVFGNTIVDVGNNNTSFRELTRVPDELIDLINNKASLGSISAYININAADGSSDLYGTVDVKQVGYIGRKNINASNEKFYTFVKGEKYSGDAVLDVNGAFHHMLETYDGIGSSDINYGNLPTKRNKWFVGRQLTQRKNSFEYLKGLAKQSFVGIFPTRDSKRGLTAWLNNTTPIQIHNQTNIIRDSIISFVKTPISKLYNEFSLDYSWNPGAGKYDRNLFITNLTASSFPAIDSNWKEFVGGVSDSGYVKARLLWEKCRESYLRVNVARKNGSDVGSLPWYSDPGVLAKTSTGNVIPTYYGDATTQISFTVGPSGGVMRLLFVGGTPANFESDGLQVGDELIINSPNLSSGNNGTFSVVGPSVGVGDNVVDIYNTGGVVESKTMDINTALFSPGHTAFSLLESLVDWTTLQKDVVSYSLPINSTFIILELLNSIAFNDAIYTNGTNRLGWTTSIEVDPKNDKMNLELILIPGEGEILNSEIEDTYTSYASHGWADWEDTYTSQEPTNADIEDSYE